MRNLGMWALGLMLTLNLSLGWARTEERPEIRTETKVERTAIPFDVKYEVSRTVGRGRVVKKQDGQPGEVRRIYQITILGNGKSKRELLRTERTEPKPAIFHMGRSGFQTSRSSFARGRVLTVQSTAYTPCAGRGAAATFRTKTGRRAEYGVIAVDPKVIPLNTLVFVEGYGLAIAADIGSAIRGNKIDVCLPTRAEALAWGRRSVRIHILRPR
ncbi:MAG TPA: 3D domain-containing protein [Fimbriimonadaceae bacterium]|nr:3D domain-containing protein [Fimbriimonadaceae bacterium]HRJ32198.1 3D domain-containing protein [Fimbriimonadaceae bacterium]